MAQIDFNQAFHVLTGNAPFPWLCQLYKRFVADRPDNIPSSCDIPTGLGKTSVITVWLIALANRPDKMPRRLVYVVNRRTVVDQTTIEVEKLRASLSKAALDESLRKLCAIDLADIESPLAISTLRGQFADNREWSADPARPAVICGTVDMIGSRLLFSGYGVGFKGKPLHAGFLGQDVLLVHDEAHLEPAFQRLLLEIQKEQDRCKEFRKFHVMELSATSRGGGGNVVQLTIEEKNPPSVIPTPPTEPIHHVWMRLTARKGIKFHSAKRDEIAKTIGVLARRWKSSGKAVLVFVRTIEDVKTVQQVLTDKKEGAADQVQVLTGTLRGLERDRLATDDPIFARFLLKSQPDGRTVYLICTSAGEVGVDMSADHLVCDLTTLDSMIQRLGRVNRRGGADAEVDVVYENEPDPKQKDKDYETARWNTLAILRKLPGCNWINERQEASPLALRNLLHADDEEERNRKDKEWAAAFAPPPTILPVTDILFDSWALTTIREKLPGRPPVEPYLHGISEWEPPQTKVAWREEVWELRREFEDDRDRKQFQKYAAELLEDYPLKAHETLADRSDRVLNSLKKVAAPPETPVWIVDNQDAVTVTTLGEVIDGNKEALNYRTVLLPPDAGGLETGLLTPSSKIANDVADEWYEDKERQVKRRVRVWDDDPQFEEKTKDMRLIRPPIDTKPHTDETDDEESTRPPLWHWYVRPRSADDDGSKTAKVPITWQHHTNDVTANAERIASAMFGTDSEFHKAFILAAKLHDLGKRRVVWQRSIGNPIPTDWYAKSGKGWKPREITEYRHEFGSLLDLENEPDFLKLDDNAMKDLVRHIIAVHHGYGRPHFPPEKAFDPNAKGEEAAEVAAEVPRRFARLQRKYGRWGLAYLESLLRAADWAASANATKPGGQS